MSPTAESDASNDPIADPHHGHRSVRSLMVGVATLMAVTVGVVGAWLSVQDFRGARADAIVDTGFRARVAAEALGDSVAETSDLLSSLALQPTTLAVFALPEECQLAGGGATLFPEGHLDLIFATGDVFCSSTVDKGAPSGISAAGLAWFRDAMATDAIVISDPFDDPITGEPSLAIARRIPGADGAPAGLVVAVHHLGGVGEELADTYSAGRGFGFAVIDPDSGRIVASSIDASSVGGAAVGAPIAGEGRTSWPDGRERIVNGASIPGTSWVLLTAIDEKTAFADAWEDLRGRLLLLGLAVLVLLIGGMVIYRRIARPVNELTRAVEEATRSGAPAPVAVTGPREIAILVNDFNEMLATRGRYEAELAHRALHDELTGLPNRALLIDRLSAVLKRRGTEPGSIALLLLDLDRFKVINEGAGHEAGDEALRIIGSRLQTAIRPGDTVGRLGGDEFAVLCEDLHSREQVRAIAERMLAVVGERMEVGGDRFSFTASIGIATGPTGSSPYEMLRDADAAMSRAKERTDAGWLFFDESVRSHALTRQRLEADLRRALEQHEIEPWFQPEVDLETGDIVSFEALARWMHPKLGVQPPLTFIPIAEESGLILPLGLAMAHRAAEEAVAWRQAGFSRRVAVNVSAKQIAQPTFLASIEELLVGSGLAAEALVVEITESTLMQGTIAVEEVLTQVKGLGVKLSVDDFGTGYSSLAYLQRFPVDQLKIDRAFVRNIATAGGSRSLVAGMLAIAEALDISVVAEGVETPEQVAVLRSLGCRYAQGYLFGKPRPANEVVPLLRRDAGSVAASNAG